MEQPSLTPLSLKIDAGIGAGVAHALAVEVGLVNHLDVAGTLKTLVNHVAHLVELGLSLVLRREPEGVAAAGSAAVVQWVILASYQLPPPPLAPPVLER